MSVANTQPALESPESEIEAKAPLAQLARDMIDAGRLGDRERFDRLCSLAFGIAYGAAWRQTGDVHAARKLAACRLLRALRAV